MIGYVLPCFSVSAADSESINQQPKKSDPTFGVSHPEKATYQWQKLDKTHTINYTFDPDANGWTEDTENAGGYKSKAEDNSDHTLNAAINNIAAPAEISFTYKNFFSGGRLEYKFAKADAIGSASYIELDETGEGNDVVNTIHLTAPSDGNYILSFLNYAGSGGNSTSSVRINDIEKWVNVSDAEQKADETFNKTTDPSLDGATMRCVVTYPESNVQLVSNTFTYELVTVKFDLNDGKSTTTQEPKLEQVIPYNTTADFKWEPEKEGYEFIGWFIDGIVNPIGHEYKFTKDVTVKAEYKKITTTPEQSEKITIRFFSNGIEFAEKTIDKGSTVKFPTPPKNDGYKLVGWHDDHTGAPVYETTVFTKNTPVDATWEKLPDNSVEGETGTAASKSPLTIRLFLGSTIVRVYDAPNGTITPNGMPIIAAGMTQTFKFIPDEGYVVSDVLVNGESIGAVESYTIDGWQGYVKLTAVFEAKDGE